MATYCLLIFSFNSNDDVLRLFRSLKGSVDEIIIIDSSDNEQYHSLCSSIGEAAKVYRVIPLGITDLYRSYATSKIRSEYVLNLDCDEAATPEFIRDFRSLNSASAYLVGWHHVKIEETAKKLILYRNGSVTYMGHVFESPKVKGPTVDISSSYQILHYADFEGGYGAEHSRYERYFFYEAIGRPFTWKTLLREINLNFLAGRLGKDLTDELMQPSYVSKAIILGAYIERIIRRPEQKNVARFLLQYGFDRVTYFSRLNKNQKKLFVSISNRVYEHDGLAHYLGLDDPNYLDDLTKTFDWKTKGIDVARKLIMFRFLEGKPLSSFLEMPYSEEQLNDFWNGRYKIPA